MPKFGPDKIINIAFCGHNGSGKTSLADQILFKLKATSSQPSIDSGTSVMDWDPESKNRKATVDVSMAYAVRGDTLLNMLDTPGYGDLIAQTICALNGADTAVVCINAQSGIMVTTRKAWAECEKRNIARVLVISKCDIEIDLPALITDIRDNFGPECVPLLVPDRTGPSISKCVNLLQKQSDSQLSQWRQLLVERVAETDDALMEKYFESNDLPDDDLRKGLKNAVSRKKLFPIICLSVSKDVAVNEFVDFIFQYLPRASECSEISVAANEEKEVKVHLDAPFTAKVFKCFGHQYIGKMAMAKIVTGTVSGDAQITNVRTRTAAKIGAMFKFFGKDQNNQAECGAGDIVVFTKLEDVQIGDSLTIGQGTTMYKGAVFPTPMLSVAAEPKTKTDEAKINPSMQKYADSDPTFKFGRDTQTLELVISAMSRLHLDISINRIKNLYDCGINVKKPKIPYKETVLASGNGHCKYKKQTGGRGHYAEVYLKVEPLERGKGFEYVNQITQGRIPAQYIPWIEKGIRQSLEKGLIANCQIVDVRVLVVDGSFHEVDSRNEDFMLAGQLAFEDGFMKSKPTLLEPIMNITIVVPQKYTGDITGQISSKRGRIISIESKGRMGVITAQIPMKEVMDYQSELTALTSGEGSYSLELSHYDTMPAQLAQTIIQEVQAAKQAAQKSG